MTPVTWAGVIAACGTGAAVSSRRKPATWTRIDHGCEALGIGMQTLFDDPGAAESCRAT
jgi:hypothetical protein